MTNKCIPVTKPTLAPLDEYIKLLEGVWETGILTHNGPMVRRLESDLQKKLDVRCLSLVTNGTIAIQMAIKALELKGDIITTPFSWVATVNAIKWEGCNPIFCDVDPETFNIDVTKIESLITEKTVAIIPVHVFGVPCDVSEIERIAAKHNLKVIYDAAHAIGSTYEEQSLLSYGDISTISLHGTKLFNTAEGGACITNAKEYKEKIDRIRFFGHNESKEIVEDGFNGKMTEIHAALGIANLKYFDDVVEDRKRKYLLYKEKLSSIKGLTFQKINVGESNYSYFPVVFDSETTLTRVVSKLNEFGFYPRRYFYPSLNTLTNIVDYSEMPASESISSRILCLPLYYELTASDIVEISELIGDELQ